MKPKKRLFLGLALVGLLCMVIFIWFGWYFSQNPTGTAVKFLLTFFAALVLFFVFVGLGGIALLVIAFFSSRSLGALNLLTIKILNLIYPLVLVVSKILRVDTDKMKRSYIEVHNQLTRLRLQHRDFNRLLILAPHCLQDSECPYKITVDINNCCRCGRCPINQLCVLADNYEVELAVVTGGTLARDFVKRFRPEGIIAIACERDLTSGIQDVAPLPVIGVLNSRPNGPCFNTEIDFLKVAKAIEMFLDKKQEVSKTGVAFSDNKD